MDDKVRKVLSRLELQCARREYCSADIYAKALKVLEGDAEAASEVLASLKGNGFVDDARYAAAFAREKSALGGWGEYKIRLALAAKKIEASVIAGALKEIDRDKAGEKLHRLLSARRKALEGDPCMKLKLIRYALSRGYSYEDVQGVVDECE